MTSGEASLPSLSHEFLRRITRPGLAAQEGGAGALQSPDDDDDLFRWRGEHLLRLAELLWRKDALTTGKVEAHASDSELEQCVREIIDALVRGSPQAKVDRMDLLVRFKLPFDQLISASKSALPAYYVPILKLC